MLHSTAYSPFVPLDVERAVDTALPQDVRVSVVPDVLQGGTRAVLENYVVEKTTAWQASYRQ